MRILVTGGTGVFGRALCERLTARGDHDVAMARREPTRPLPAAEFRAGDVRDVAVTAAMEGCTAVAHLAWAFAPLETREGTERLDIGGTRDVVAAMAATGCRRRVFSSSVLTYGVTQRHGRLLREDEPLRPDLGHLYGTHKRMAEEVIFSSPIEAVPCGRASPRAGPATSTRSSGSSPGLARSTPATATGPGSSLRRPLVRLSSAALRRVPTPGGEPVTAPVDVSGRTPTTAADALQMALGMLRTLLAEQGQRLAGRCLVADAADLTLARLVDAQPAAPPADRAARKPLVALGS